MNRGNVCRRSGNYEEALASYREGLKIKPDSWELMYNIGSVLILQEKYKEAEEMIDCALKLNPEDGECWYCKAICREKKGDPDGAKEAWETALKHKPQERPGHIWGKEAELLDAPHGPAMGSEVIKGI